MPYLVRETTYQIWSRENYNWEYPNHWPCRIGLNSDFCWNFRYIFTSKIVPGWKMSYFECWLVGLNSVQNWDQRKTPKENILGLGKILGLKTVVVLKIISTSTLADPDNRRIRLAWGNYCVLRLTISIVTPIMDTCRMNAGWYIKSNTSPLFRSLSIVPYWVLT